MATASACLSFDGTNDNVTFGDITIFDGLSAFSMVCWLNPVSTSGNRSVWRKDGTLTPFQIFTSFGVAGTVIWPNASFSQPIAIIPSNDSWQSYASTWGKSDNSGKISYYKDATFVGDSSAVQTVDVTSSGSTGMFMGSTESGSEWYSGKFAWAIAYNRKLSANEIKDVYINPYSIPDGIIGFWSLNDIGSTQYDQSDNSNNGTLSGPTTNTNGPPVFLLGGQ